MNIYEVIYIRGYDHDDWDKFVVTAENEAEAERKGEEQVPPGCRVKKIKFLDVRKTNHYVPPVDDEPYDMWNIKDMLDDFIPQTRAPKRTNPSKMAQAKISRIEPANPPTWQGSHGMMYAFDVELSDGTQGSVNTKSPNKWNVGDDVEYTATSTHHGNKLKLDKPGFSGGFSGGKQDPDATKGIIASWAVGIAMQVADRDAPNYDVEVMQYARLALEARKQIKNEVQP